MRLLLLLNLADLVGCYIVWRIEKSVQIARLFLDAYHFLAASYRDQRSHRFVQVASKRTIIMTELHLPEHPSIFPGLLPLMLQQLLLKVVDRWHWLLRNERLVRRSLVCLGFIRVIPFVQDIGIVLSQELMIPSCFRAFFWTILDNGWLRILIPVRNNIILLLKAEVGAASPRFDSSFLAADWINTVLGIDRHILKFTHRYFLLVLDDLPQRSGQLLWINEDLFLTLGAWLTHLYNYYKI